MMKDNQFSLSDHDEATNNIEFALSKKVEYLNQLREAIKQQDDRLVYQLINQSRYAQLLLKKRSVSEMAVQEELVVKDYPQIQQYLSLKLISYLRDAYPFFYFEEMTVGKFKIHFGNWWDRKEFGYLDVLNVEFKFDEEELAKLAKSFELESTNKRVNTDKINQISTQNKERQELVDSQDERDAEKDKIREEMKRNSQEKGRPWDAGRIREERRVLKERLTKLTEMDEEANSAYQDIKSSETDVLSLAKEDTLIGYERQSVIGVFGDFEKFTKHNNELYSNYLSHLISQKRQVTE